MIFNEQRYYYPVELCRRLEIITVLYVDYYTKDGYKLLYGFDALICNTKRHYNVFKNHRQAIYIPWGTSKESYPFSEKDRPFDFFHSAGMNPVRKGTDVYIKALTHLARDNYKFRALIHTQVDILKFFPELRDSLKILQEGGLLKIVHATVTAPGLYNQAFSYIYPSRLDGIGLTVPEALMSGCYVLTSNEEPMSEFIKKDDNGSLIDIDNRASRSDNYYWDMVEPSPASLTIQMKGLLSLDKTDRLDIAVRCRSYAMQYLDWNTNAAALPDQIKNLKRIKIEDHLLSAWEKADGAIPYYRKLSRFYSAVYKFLFFVKRRVNG